MQRNTKNYYFVIGGVFAASLEGFATVIIVRARARACVCVCVCVCV